MTSQRLFIRKVTYLAAIGGLLFALVLLGRPAASDSRGGRLAQMREDHRLGQSQFGEIDLAGETLKLASFGMQGFAAMALWQDAHEYKKKENWSGYERALNQIAQVMPNFTEVWRFQAWNLSYNIAVEFDDYRHKYEWVKKGIAFLKRGKQYNEHDPRLRWDIGWFTCQKIGRSDEQKEYRRMFREENAQDNWLVGKSWYEDAQRLVDEKGIPYTGMNQAVFHSHPALAQMYYCQAIEQDGLEVDYRGLSAAERDRRVAAEHDRWRRAWEVAESDWQRLGDRPFSVGQGVIVRMNEGDALDKQFFAAAEALAALDPALWEALLVERREELVDDERQALETLPGKRSIPQRHALLTALFHMRRAYDFVDRLPEARRVEARRLADEASYARARLEVLDGFRNPVNYGYWGVRARAEQHAHALTARQLLDEARQAAKLGRLQPARRLFERAFHEWSLLLKEFPELVDDVGTGSDMTQAVLEYRRIVVDLLDEKFPEPFILDQLIDVNLPGRPEYYYFRKPEEGPHQAPEPQ